MAEALGRGLRRWFSLLGYWGPLLVYMGLIFCLSSQPQPKLLHDAPDYVLHFVAYCGLAVLAVRAVARGLLAPAKLKAVFLGLGLSFTYALSDEWHQSFVPGRTASGWDVLADGLGILAAWASLTIFWYYMRTKTRQWSGTEGDS